MFAAMATVSWEPRASSQASPAAPPTNSGTVFSAAATSVTLTSMAIAWPHQSTTARPRATGMELLVLAPAATI